MEKKWVLDNLLIMLPAILILVIFIGGAKAYPADWAFHISGNTSGNYGILAPWLTSAAYRAGLILPFCIMLVIALPYILLHKITGSALAPTLYLYASGIPFILMWGGFFAQAFIHLFMLLNLISPWLWPFTLLLGMETHREWLGSWALSVAVWIYRRWSSGSN